MTKHELMKRAIEEAREGIRAGHGGPFGTVIVKDGQIVGRGHNCVLRDHDATCHGEVAAIRDAGRHLGTPGAPQRASIVYRADYQGI